MSALFLDILGAFPNAATDRLLHNMKRRQVPTAIVDFVKLMLTNRQTRIIFDNYTSEWIPLANGIGQGDPLSMILYLYYSADLVDNICAAGREGTRQVEDAEAWVDDTVAWVITDTPEEGVERLQNIMNRPGGAFQWSQEHNSKFDVGKFAFMCFSRNRKKACTNITIRGQSIAPKASHKHLGVVLDQELRWREHEETAVVRATKWTLLFRQLAKVYQGMSPTTMRQLYLAVAVPKALYAADVWLTPPHKKPGAKRKQGSIRACRRLESMQQLATIAIMGPCKGRRLTY